MAKKKSRQIVVMGVERQGGSVPLGTLREVRSLLERYNTSGDGTPAGVLERLYGPGMVVELPTSGEVVNQAIAWLNDEDTAFPVLRRLCKETGWRLMDLETGRTFG